MDDERLKNPPGKGQTDYFDEMLGRIRDIRSCERRFYQYVLDIYATQRGLLTGRGEMTQIFSPPCRTRCTGPHTATQQPRSSTSGQTQSSPTWG